MIEIKMLTKENMKENGLDDYCRTQIVKRQYRMMDDDYILVEEKWVMDWDRQKKCEIAKSLISDNYIAFGAFENDRIIGFVSVESKLRGERLVLDMIQVSQEYRGAGLGRKLFQIAKERAKVLGARQLYISACSAEETINFYKAMGGKIAENPIKEIAEEEPMDLQMVCDIVSNDFFVSGGEFSDLRSLTEGRTGGVNVDIKNINKLTEQFVWNDAVGLVTKSLGEASGSQKFYVNIDYVPPGAYSTQYHSHSQQEEFFLILSGTGTLRLNGEEILFQSWQGKTLPIPFIIPEKRYCLFWMLVQMRMRIPVITRTMTCICKNPMEQGGFSAGRI